MSVRSNRTYMKLRQKSFKNSELSESEKPPSTAPELIAEHPRLQDSQTSHRDSYSECTYSHTNKKAIGKHMKKITRHFWYSLVHFFLAMDCSWCFNAGGYQKAKKITLRKACPIGLVKFQSTEYATICKASLPLVAVTLLKARLIKVKGHQAIVAYHGWILWHSMRCTSKSLRIPLSKMNPNHCTLPNSERVTFLTVHGNLIFDHRISTILCTSIAHWIQPHVSSLRGSSWTFRDEWQVIVTLEHCPLCSKTEIDIGAYPEQWYPKWPQRMPPNDILNITGCLPNGPLVCGDFG